MCTARSHYAFASHVQALAGTVGGRARARAPSHDEHLSMPSCSWSGGWNGVGLHARTGREPLRARKKALRGGQSLRRGPRREGRAGSAARPSTRTASRGHPPAPAKAPAKHAAGACTAALRLVGALEQRRKLAGHVGRPAPAGANHCGTAPRACRRRGLAARGLPHGPVCGGGAAPAAGARGSRPPAAAEPPAGRACPSTLGPGHARGTPPREDAVA
jgi:hypothetical protein